MRDLIVVLLILFIGVFGMVAVLEQLRATRCPSIAGHKTIWSPKVGCAVKIDGIVIPLWYVDEYLERHKHE